VNEQSAPGAGYDTINLLLADALNIDAQDVREDMKLQELPTWDSLGCLSLLTGLESELDIKIDPVTLFAAESLSQIRSLINYASTGRSSSA